MHLRLHELLMKLLINMEVPCLFTYLRHVYLASVGKSQKSRKANDSNIFMLIEAQDICI
jgi:hypothetical protein